VKGAPDTEYCTAWHRQEPCRAAEGLPMEVVSPKDAITKRGPGFLKQLYVLGRGKCSVDSRKDTAKAGWQDKRQGTAMRVPFIHNSNYCSFGLMPKRSVLICSDELSLTAFLDATSQEWIPRHLGVELISKNLHSTNHGIGGVVVRVPYCVNQPSGVRDGHKSFMDYCPLQPIRISERFNYRE
jgi:hypothetical protein